MEKLNLYFRGVCDLFSIRQDLPHQLWDGATADGGTNLLGTRLIHNKIMIITTHFFRCYSLPLDLFFLGQLTSVGIIVFLTVGFFLVSRRQRFFYLPFLFIPFMFIFPGNWSVEFKLQIYRYYIHLLPMVVAACLLIAIVQRRMRYAK